jgi:hypothetical protein
LLGAGASAAAAVGPLVVRLRIFKAILAVPENTGGALSALWVVDALFMRTADNPIGNYYPSDAVGFQEGRDGLTNPSVDTDVELAFVPALEVSDAVFRRDADRDFRSMTVGRTVERDGADWISFATIGLIAKFPTPGFLHKSILRTLWRLTYQG